MLTHTARIMAFGGGVWGIGLSLTLLSNRQFDAWPFLLTLLFLSSAPIAIALWPSIKPLWRTTVWLGIGCLLGYFVFLSRFTIGIFVIPTAGLIFLAGILALADRNPPFLQGEVKADASRISETVIAVQPRSDKVDPHLHDLTPRESEVLVLIAQGKSNQEIANTLVISPNTVRHHVHQLLRKLNCSSRGEAAIVARRAGLKGLDTAGTAQSPYDTD